MSDRRQAQWPWSGRERDERITIGAAQPGGPYLRRAMNASAEDSEAASRKS